MATFRDTCLYFYNKWVTTKLNKNAEVFFFFVENKE